MTAVFLPETLPPFPREKAIVFTGHRDLAPRAAGAVAGRIRAILDRLYHEGFRRVYAGGALGFDMLAEIIFLNGLSRWPDMELALVLPCREHDRKWTQTQKRQFAVIRGAAQIVVCPDREYKSGCMLARDRFMVERASVCAAYLRDGAARGGTVYTVGAARKQGLTVYNLWRPEDDAAREETEP